jgi:AcrR family transcriptional regulator
MPRTRPELDREAKEAQILDAAVAMLEAGGYDALSMAAVARELGLAQNAVYWYFPTRDHLFVAAVERMLRGIVARKPRGRSLETKVLWFVEQLHGIEHVRIALYERARVSEPVAAFAAQLAAGWRAMLSGALRERVDEAERELVADALLATIQGTLLAPTDRAERERVIRFAIARLVP